MSTLSATPSLVLTSPSDESLLNPTAVPSMSKTYGELHSIDLRTSPSILPSNILSYADKELATNAAERRPKSLSKAPQPPLNRVSSFEVEAYAKEQTKLVGNASFEGLPQMTGDPSRRGPEAHGDAVDTRRFRSRAARVQREYHKDDPSLPYTDGFSSRSDSSASEGYYDKEGVLRVEPQVISPKTKFMLPRPISPVLQLTRLFPFLSTRRLRAISDSPFLWLILYFTLNLSLTLYNKSVLIHFPFPYTLTALHALCGTIGTFILLRLNSNSEGSRLSGARLTTTAPTHTQFPSMPDLSGKELIVLFLFSILYTLNIIVSNASLRLVTVPFHQVVRASTPFFTIMFAAVLLGKRCTKNKLLSLVPVVMGVGFATYGDYYFTPFGFFLTLLGTVLASLKTILTNVILVKPSTTGLPVSSEINYAVVNERRSQPSFPPSFISSVFSLIVKCVFPPSPTQSPAYVTKSLPPASTQFSFSLPKLSLNPIHLLYLLSPLAFIQTTLLAHFTGELDRVRWHLFDPATATATYGANAVNGRMWLLLNGVLAFMLNMVSFNANRRVGPLGMSVAANVKQVLTVLSAVIIFDLTITPANGLGIVLTLIGGALYAAVEIREKREAAALIKTRVG